MPTPLRTVPRALVLAVALVSACGGEADPVSGVDAGRGSKANASAPPAARVSGSNGFSLHAWSIAAFEPETAAQLRLLSLRRRDVLVQPRSTLFSTRGRGAVYLRRTDPAGGTVNASVRFVPGNGAQLFERWPRSSGRGDGFGTFVLRRGPCERSVYPQPSDQVCALDDGRCDSAGASAYEVSDHDCLGFDAQEVPQLSLRSSVARSQLPIDLRLREDASVVTSLGGRGGTFLRIVRDEEGGSFHVGRSEVGAGASVALPVADTATSEPEQAVLALVRASQLTPTERGAFGRAIRRTLEEPGAPRDAVVYLVDSADTAPLLPLEASPAAASIERTVLVVLSLDPAVRPPRSRDPEPTIRVRTDGHPVVSGGSIDAHRRVVLENVEALEACVRAAYVPGRMIAERLVVRYQVGPTGEVRTAIADDPSASNRRVVACVESTFLGFAFPETRSPVALGRIPISLVALPPRD